MDLPVIIATRVNSHSNRSRRSMISIFVIDLSHGVGDRYIAHDTSAGNLNETKRTVNKTGRV